jgi:hypothetical protein
LLGGVCNSFVVAQFIARQATAINCLTTNGPETGLVGGKIVAFMLLSNMLKQAVVCFVVVGMVWLVFATPALSSPKLTIVYTADVKGELEPCG